MAKNYNECGMRGNCLCGVCGDNINTEDVVFGMRDQNLVYMDKVYSYNKATACPLLSTIATGTEWVVETLLEPAEEHGRRRGGSCGPDCGCGCECTLGADAVFTITRSYVVVSGLALGEGDIEEADITVDGVAVDSVVQSGNRYVATTDNLVAQINREKCQERGLASKHFFLITGAGPWTFRGSIVLEGTVNTGGKTCCFQVKFTTPDDGIFVSGDSTFAVQKLALPCTTNGVSPTIECSFGGIVNVLNPAVTVTASADGAVTLGLTGSLAVQPQLSVEVVRRTLFLIEAREGFLPCDGTEEAYELDNEEDCECGNGLYELGEEGSVYGCGTSGNDGENRARRDTFQWNGCSGCSW